MSKLRTALAAIHSSQTDRPTVSGPASALLLHGIRLMIDMCGTSDSLLNRLAEEGIARPSHVIRHWMHILSDCVDPLNCRSPPLSEEEVHISCWTGNNADFHIFHRCVSVVPIANILLECESREDANHFNNHFMSGLRKLSDVNRRSCSYQK